MNGFLKIRVKPGSELPAAPDNKRPGQWQYDGDWYPQAKGGKPGQLTSAWAIVPEGAALAAQSFFTQNGECLVETEPYDGPTTPSDLAAPALDFGGRKFANVDELVAFVRGSDTEERTRQIRSRQDELSKLDKTALQNEARIANVSTTGNEETLRSRLIDAQFGEGAALTAPGPTGTTVSGEIRPGG
jgi:hypothetical protein